MSGGAKIIQGLRDAIKGNFARPLNRGKPDRPWMGRFGEIK